jgi:hypothetical protein
MLIAIVQDQQQRGAIQNRLVMQFSNHIHEPFDVRFRNRSRSRVHVRMLALASIRTMLRARVLAWSLRASNLLHHFVGEHSRS